MTRQFFRTAVVLGLITAVGPFAIDMYLPALPSLGRSLHATASAVQMSLTVYFVVIGIAQLVYGPLSDIAGRKRPIYAGLVVFVIGSIGCALSPNIDVLIGFRALQAAGACAGMVVPRAIVRDLHTGHAATQLMSMLMLVVSLSPILAPLTGSLVIGAVGWRGVFGVLTLASLLALALATGQLKETRPAAHRTGSSWAGSFAVYRRLLADPFFVGLVLVGAFGMASFFIFLGSASFVLIDHYGLSPLQFSLCFSLNAVSYFGFSQLAGTLTRRFGLTKVVRGSVTGLAAVMAALAVSVGLGADSLATLIAFLVVGYGFLGIVMPTTAVLALEDNGPNAGTASALMGAVRMIIGGVTMASVGFFAHADPGPMVAGITACALLSLLITQLTVRPTRRLVSVAAD